MMHASADVTDRLSDSINGIRSWLDGRTVAIVQEWIDANAGSEQVFETLAQLIPNADLFALSRKPTIELDVGGRAIRTTVLDRPALRDRRALVLPLMPPAWRALGRARYDVVVTNHHAFAHTNRLCRPDGIHLCYVQSPARYVWSPEIDGRAPRFTAPVREVLKGVDRRASKRVHSYAANSTAVARRVKEFWGRDATILHPAVRADFFGAGSTTTPTRDYVLGFGRWIPYKNMHLVVEAADIAGVPVKIAGRGPEKERILAALRAARVPGELIESPSDEILRELYRNAACLIFPTYEDFGIVPVECQAAGTPVVAPSGGGALDTIIDGKTGVLVKRLNTQELAAAISVAVELNPAEIRQHAQQFTPTEFASTLLRWFQDQNACTSVANPRWPE